MTGYAILDLETTGILPGFHHRIAEVAVVLADSAGRVESEWCTLVNPERDLGPQGLHGIAAADILDAPIFADIAGYVAELLTGRVLVAHNLAFELMHLRAEFGRLEVTFPVTHDAGVCTMTWGTRLMPGAGRRLADCCYWAGIDFDPDAAHAALTDAQATARLLTSYLLLVSGVPPWHSAVEAAARCGWPPMPRREFTIRARGAAGHETERHFLARLVDRLPPYGQAAMDSYLAILDATLLDRMLSLTETRALIACAESMGLGRQGAEQAHCHYLEALAAAAWADGVITEAERADLHTTAELLGLSPEAADTALERSRPSLETKPAPELGRFALGPGDSVVFTGAMTRSRDDWEEQARRAGLNPQCGVTKKTKLVIAADPDSLSGKAAQARRYGIPIVSEDFFTTLLGTGSPLRSSS